MTEGRRIEIEKTLRKEANIASSSSIDVGLMVVLALSVTAGVMFAVGLGDVWLGWVGDVLEWLGMGVGR